MSAQTRKILLTARSIAWRKSVRTSSFSGWPDIGRCIIFMGNRKIRFEIVCAIYISAPSCTLPSIELPSAPSTKAGLVLLETGIRRSALFLSSAPIAHSLSQLSAPTGKPHTVPRKNTKYFNGIFEVFSEKISETVKSDSTINRNREGMIETAQIVSARRIPSMLCQVMCPPLKSYIWFSMSILF